MASQRNIYLIIFFIIILLIFLFLQKTYENFDTDTTVYNVAKYVKDYNGSQLHMKEKQTNIQNIKIEPAPVYFSQGNDTLIPPSVIPPPTQVISTTVPNETTETGQIVSHPVMYLDNPNVIIENTSISLTNLYLFGTFIESYLNIPLLKIDPTLSRIDYNDVIEYYNSMTTMLYNLYGMLAYSGFDLNVFINKGKVPIGNLTPNGLLKDLNNIKLPIIDFRGSKTEQTMPATVKNSDITQTPSPSETTKPPLSMPETELNLKIIDIPKINNNILYIGKDKCIYTDKMTSQEQNTLPKNIIIPAGTSITLSNIIKLYNSFIINVKKPADQYMQKYIDMYNINKRISQHNKDVEFKLGDTNLADVFKTSIPLLNYQSLIYDDNGNGNKCIWDYNNFISKMHIGFNVIKTYYVNIATKPNYTINA